MFSSSYRHKLSILSIYKRHNFFKLIMVNTHHHPLQFQIIQHSNLGCRMNETYTFNSRKVSLKTRCHIWTPQSPYCALQLHRSVSVDMTTEAAWSSLSDTRVSTSRVVITSLRRFSPRHCPSKQFSLNHSRRVAILRRSALHFSSIKRLLWKVSRVRKGIWFFVGVLVTDRGDVFETSIDSDSVGGGVQKGVDVDGIVIIIINFYRVGVGVELIV